MENNKKILDLFGKLFVETVFDENLERHLKSFENNPQHFFNNKLDKRDFILFFYENFESLFWDFFKLFTDNVSYKIIFQDEFQILDLTGLSDMLYAEHQTKYGWIHQYSKVLTEEDKKYIVEKVGY